jgi:hypothetical protein
MIRSSFHPCYLALVVLLAGTHRPAEAQFIGLGYPGWPFGHAGSTPPGDLLNGLGAAAVGAGLYNVNSATAWSILTDAWIRRNQYDYEARRQWALERAVHYAYRRKRNTDSWAKIHERVTNTPELADIHRGDTLNALTRTILDAKLPPSAQRFPRIGVPGGVLQKVPLVDATSQTTITLARLELSSAGPLLLHEPVFDASRRRYETALDCVLAQVAARALSIPALDALDRAIDDLKVVLELNTSVGSAADCKHARAFLDRLVDTTHALRNPGIADVLSEVNAYHGTTVGELLSFMKRHDLRFGRAESPAERELFETLYPLLGQHREKLLELAANN